MRTNAATYRRSAVERVVSALTADHTVEALAGLMDLLRVLPTAVDDAERIDRIAALDRLQAAVVAVQARETTDFAASQLAAQVAARVPRSRRGRGIAEQIGLARRLSPTSAARQLSLAQAWRRDLPAVFEALGRGQTSEWAATLIARETTGLDRLSRQRIAEELAPQLPALSPRQVGAAARRMAYESDPRAILARGRTARADRRVGIRPAPDTMSVLSAFLPAEQGIAAWANLDRHARTVRAAGDPRGHGQVMADTLVERLTGQPTAAAVPVEIGITMTADSLLANGAGGADQTPAELDGYGPIPADLALDLAAQAAGPDADRPSHAAGPAATDTECQTAVWVRRLFTDPVDESIAHVDTKRRRFDGHLARLIRHRDQVCRDPYCTAPIRHLDHVQPYRDGGPTSSDNGAGLCERGNYAKDMPGWQRRVLAPSADDPTDRGDQSPKAPVIEIETPTGHCYTSPVPPALGPGGHYRERNRLAALRRLSFLTREKTTMNLSPRSSDPARRGCLSEEPQPP